MCKKIPFDFIKVWVMFSVDYQYLMTQVYTNFNGKPEGKRPRGRSIYRWKDNIRMDLRKVGLDDVKLINLSQDRG
jgi:hypothetical protein